MDLRRLGWVVAAAGLALPLTTSCSTDAEPASSADCAVSLRYEGVVYEQVASLGPAGRPAAGQPVEVEISSCDDTGEAGDELRGAYFADPPETSDQVAAIRGVDPSDALLSPRDPSARTVAIFLNTELEPADRVKVLRAIEQS